MVPAKLKLSNFTSYGESSPELDFSTFKMAAISGQNGAGKSSLLDAITWCVWGCSRAGDSSDALVKLGKTEMSVDFSFQLDGNLYTVKRRRIKKSGGNTSLEFWSNSHNLTEGTIKATQQKIINTLHLTFDTFINSSFIRQGHADEFTMKGPTERKKILADILGLDHYDKLEEKAKDRSKEAQTKLALLDYQVLEIEAELSQKEEREKILNQLQAEVATTTLQQQEVELLIKTIEEEKQVIQVSVNLLLDKKQSYETIDKEVSQLKAQIALKEQSKSEYQTFIDKKDLIEKSYLKLQTLREDRQKLETKRSELIKRKDELVTLEKTISTREEGRTKAISDIEIQVKGFSTKNATLLEQNKRLLDQKLLCPTCGQPIGEKQNKEMIGKNDQEIKKNEEQIEELQKKITKYQSVTFPEQGQAKDKELEVKKLEEETKEYAAIEKQLTELAKAEQAYMKLQQAEVAIKASQESITDLEKNLTIKEQELQKMKTFEEELTPFQAKLQEIEQKLAAQVVIKQTLSQKILELTGKAGQAKQLMDRASQLENLFKQKQADKQKLSKEKETYEELSLAFGKKGIQAMIIEQAIPEIEEEANKLLEQLTEGRMKVSLETQKETKTKVLGAEGKKEHGTVETLEIVISDEMGERPYELYSGGETFRVNFALRLAISKLLAHRAGAKLQFLVIDEGFGTQDAPGRARLVEVLDSIKSDFEKIVIITHIEELKAEFPTRIEVAKTATGSTFEVIGG